MEVYGVTGINFKWKERQTHTNLVFWPSEYAEPNGFFGLVLFEYYNPITHKESYTNYKIIVQYYSDGEFHGRKEFSIDSKRHSIELIVQKIVFWASSFMLWQKRFNCV
jgi:hypothetical protein